MISSKIASQNGFKILQETGYSPLSWEITANYAGMINKLINIIITNLTSYSCTRAFVKVISFDMGQAGSQIETVQRELVFFLC